MSSTSSYFYLSTTWTGLSGLCLMGKKMLQGEYKDFLLVERLCLLAVHHLLRIDGHCFYSRCNELLTRALCNLPKQLIPFIEVANITLMGHALHTAIPSPLGKALFRGAYCGFFSTFTRLPGEAKHSTLTAPLLSEKLTIKLNNQDKKTQETFYNHSEFLGGVAFLTSEITLVFFFQMNPLLGQTAAHLISAAAKVALLSSHLKSN